MAAWKKALLAADKKKAMPILSFPCVQLMGITVSELISDSRLQAEGMKRVAGRVDSLAALTMMDLSVEAEAFGSAIRKSADEVPTVTGRIIKTEEDADNLIVPSVTAGRTGTYIEAVKIAVNIIKDRPVFAGVIGPFSLAGRLMDMSEIMVNCYAEPDMVAKTLERTAEFITAYIKEFKKAGANGVIMAEPAAGLLSPSLADGFSSRYIKKIVDEVKSDEFIFIYHNCGPNTPLMLDSLIGIGADAYHFGDAVSISEILNKMPPDKLIMGNVSPSNEFLGGTPESIHAKTTQLLNECCKHKNFVISSGCDIPPMSSWQNIDSFFKAVKNY